MSYEYPSTERLLEQIAVLESKLAASAEQERRAKALLWKFGFQAVLCGFDGITYYECRECKAYESGHKHKTGLTKETALHKPNCAARAILDETGKTVKSQGETS
jgi:hypothetical protein